MIDYEALAKSRLTSVFQGKTAIEAVVCALPSQLTLLEDVADQVKNGRSIETAIGVQLDKIGASIGELRLGRTDDEYRQALKFRVFLNVSKGRPSDVMYATKYITNGVNIQYIESFPATAIVYTDGYDSNSDTPIGVQDVAPAAISNIQIISSFGDDALRMSGMDDSFDSASELAGVQLGVLVTMSNKRLVTLDGRRIKLKENYRILQSNLKLSGVF